VPRRHVVSLYVLVQSVSRTAPVHSSPATASPPAPKGLSLQQTSYEKGAGKRKVSKYDKKKASKYAASERDIGLPIPYIYIAIAIPRFFNSSIPRSLHLSTLSLSRIASSSSSSFLRLDQTRGYVVVHHELVKLPA
jgi:hypothetical protein